MGLPPGAAPRRRFSRQLPDRTRRCDPISHEAGVAGVDLRSDGHFLTLPLFLVPRWWMVPPVWAMVNPRGPGASHHPAARPASRAVTPAPYVFLAGLAVGSAAQHVLRAGTRAVEMALTLAALVWVTRGGTCAGILLGIAAMIVCARRVPRLAGAARPVAHRQGGVATILVICGVAQLTLGWQNNGLALRPCGTAIPQVSADTQSVTSAPSHRAGPRLHGRVRPRWFPTSRATTAQAGNRRACRSPWSMDCCCSGAATAPCPVKSRRCSFRCCSC